jgi:hypothetical protein
MAAAQTLSPGEVRVSSRPYRPESQILRRESRLGQVEVVVRDINGRPVGGLTKDDFALLDSGRPRDIADFSVASERRRNAAVDIPPKRIYPSSCPNLPFPRESIKTWPRRTHFRSASARFCFTAL